MGRVYVSICILVLELWEVKSIIGKNLRKILKVFWERFLNINDSGQATWHLTSIRNIAQCRTEHILS